MNRDRARRIWTRLGDAEGGNLIEAALLLPLLLLVLSSIFEFSGILYTQMALQNGVALATRYAITRATLPSTSREDSIKTILKQDTPSLTIQDADITFSHMNTGGGSWVSGTGGPNTIERVTVTYTWTILTPFMRTFFPAGTITLSAQSAMKNEAVDQ